MQTNHEHEKSLNLADTLAEQWEAFAQFAARLTREIAGMRRRGQRGLLKNVEILEAWIRSALLQMAGEITLPKLRRARHKTEAVATATAVQTRARRAGFRAIEPDDYERQLLALKPPAFDLSQFSNTGGLRRDQRARQTPADEAAYAQTCACSARSIAALAHLRAWAG